jgi:hypothetical protein
MTEHQHVWKLREGQRATWDCDCGSTMHAYIKPMLVVR